MRAGASKYKLRTKASKYKLGLGLGNTNTPILNIKQEDLPSDEILYPMNVDSQSLGSKLKTSGVITFVQLLFLTSISP